MSKEQPQKGINLRVPGHQSAKDEAALGAGDWGGTNTQAAEGKQLFVSSCAAGSHQEITRLSVK